MLSSCDRKVSERTAKPSSAQIKSIMESVHDPIEEDGKVNYVKEIAQDSVLNRWVFDKKGRIINEEEYNSRGALISQSLYSYNQRGHLIETNVYHYKNLYRKSINKFDAEGRLIETQMVDSHNEIKEKKSISFDDKGYRMERNYSSIGANLVLDQEQIFNPKGKNTENRFFSNGTLLFTELNDFDQRGNRVECIRSSSSGNEQSIKQFKYDNQNNNVETIQLNNGFMIQSRMVYKYDKQGNRIESLSYATTGKLLNNFTMLYEYDEVGHWIRKTTVEGNQPVSVTVRNIIYY